MSRLEKISQGPRTLEDVERDLTQADLPFHMSLAEHVRNPENREQTLRLLKHLIMEEALTKPSIHATVAVYSWLVKGWPYRPSYELYKGFERELGEAGNIRTSRQEHARMRLQEFQELALPVLRFKIGFIRLLGDELIGEGRLEGRLRNKRPRRDSAQLPAIPEEDSADSLKRSTSLDSIPRT